MKESIESQVKEFMLKKLKYDDGWAYWDLSESAIREFDLVEAWDDDNHWVWDMAIEVVGASDTR